jgi:hypothetical protein
MILSPSSECVVNLPIPATPLIGRKREIADVVALLRREGACAW